MRSEVEVNGLRVAAIPRGAYQKNPDCKACMLWWSRSTSSTRNDRCGAVGRMLGNCAATGTSHFVPAAAAALTEGERP